MTTPDLDRAFLGIGWKFPLQVTPSGAIAGSRLERKIEESVFLILNTGKRERQMLPDFGCGIHDLVFAPDTPGTVAEVSASVREAPGPARAADRRARDRRGGGAGTARTCC